MTFTNIEETSNLTVPFSILLEDSKEILLDNAINDHIYPQEVKWPNEVYHSFMKLITEY